ncbi:hypothetical protein ANN_14838 [Periplaneta americana]|uniref:Uncharacterized protein n=1 Tax=Periplaneta americana TaxID=6978 RepID=A0ABQ8SXD1_PERAM|nr:hypothetical protein ANN_14838 [Periplaneta americana]
MDLREVGYDDRDWINLAQDRDRWRAYIISSSNRVKEDLSEQSGIWTLCTLTCYLATCGHHILLEVNEGSNHEWGYHIDFQQNVVPQVARCSANDNSAYRCSANDNSAYRCSANDKSALYRYKTASIDYSRISNRKRISEKSRRLEIQYCRRSTAEREAVAADCYADTVGDYYANIANDAAANKVPVCSSAVTDEDENLEVDDNDDDDDGGGGGGGGGGSGVGGDGGGGGSDNDNVHTESKFLKKIMMMLLRMMQLYKIMNIFEETTMRDNEACEEDDEASMMIQHGRF